MWKKSIIFLGFVLTFLAFLWMAMPVYANPQIPQVVFSTPTPDAAGRIVYKVQANDTCTRISILMGVSIDDIIRYNNMPDNECNITEGQELLLSIVEPSTPEPLEMADTATPASLEPTPTFFPGYADVCIYLFEDVNGNAMAEEGEVALAGGAISITDQKRSISRTGETLGDEEPVCFSELPEGEYNVSMGIPEGYNATTIVNYPLSVRAGDQVIVDFGAQVRSNQASSTTGQTTQPSGKAMSPFLAIIGFGLVLIGIGLGIYVKQM